MDSYDVLDDFNSIVVTKKKEFSQEELNELFKWDSKYLDSDLTKDKVIKHHTKKVNSKTKIVYFLRGNTTLIGYCEFEIDKIISHIKIIWLFAKGYGKLSMSSLLNYLSLKYDKIKLVSLGVSVDKTENKQAAIARFNLYIYMGFNIFNLKWDKQNEYRVILYMKRKNISLNFHHAK